MITAQELREMLSYHPETGVFRWRVERRSGNDGARILVRAGDVAGRTSRGYTQIGINNKTYYAHRLAWLYVTGEWPSAYIDHANGDKSDNRIANLRLATQAQNLGNSKRRSDNRSGWKGVSFAKHARKWVANIAVNGKSVNLGYFNCPTAAHLAYCKAAREHFGEFARTE